MTVEFRPLTEDDFALFAAWLGRPHVKRWWREPATVEHVRSEYGACTRGDLATRVYVVADGTQPIGIIQAFRLSSYPQHAELLGAPDAASIDYLIGEDSHLGRGVGTQMIGEFVERVVRDLYPDVTSVVTSVELGNEPSLGALARAGFRPGAVIDGEDGAPERVMTLALGGRE